MCILNSAFGVDVYMYTRARLLYVFARYIPRTVSTYKIASSISRWENALLDRQPRSQDPSAGEAKNVAGPCLKCGTIAGGARNQGEGI